MYKKKTELTSTESFILQNSLFAGLPDRSDRPSFFLWNNVIREHLDPFNNKYIGTMLQLRRVVEVFPFDYFKAEELSYLENSLIIKFHTHSNIVTGTYCISIFSYLEKVGSILLVPDDPEIHEKTVKFKIIVEMNINSDLNDYEKTRILFLAVICLKICIYNEYPEG